MKLHGLTIEQKMVWERDGFLVLDGFLSDNEIKFHNEQMDEAFRKLDESGKVNPETGQLSNVQQVCGVIEYGESFVKLMENHRMMQILRDLMGDSFVMIDNEALIKPPQKESHTNWHRDTNTLLHVNEKAVPLMVKVFYFLSDVHYDGGCLAFLPGSVHMANEKLPKCEKQEEMPGHVRMNVKAGTAVIFHGYTYHSALNNFTDHTRRSLIYNYGNPMLRAWPGYEPSEELKVTAHTPLRKMLLGMKPWFADAGAFKEEEAKVDTQ
ncbi:phytanoyl-CoA dioxygenase family protein [Paenibacillus mendelii]|uniref:Phytanoyl-CoA dioxygenase family protein n=1 Tax=Paenibacillus mendelii TaxID=206163 RepID=A0ABV6JIG8_9BACL|nr:phytanoyl-CoA dioxygenase family protein [Paenibacillus mendelii]MCQ6563237.1 phytanoyl-CoA dioxygenase family protein [Paenibacillus mendelii]